MGGVMASEEFDDLVDRIYEASVAPERWPDVLGRLSHIADGDLGLLFTESQGASNWFGGGKADLIRGYSDYVEEGWPERTDRPKRLFAAGHAGFLGDLDVYTLEEIEREPVFTEFLRPRGLGWGAATAIPIPNGDAIAISIERRYSRGPVERSIIRQLDLLRPHLARSALISARLQLERLRGITMTLDAIGLPAAVVGREGRLLTVDTRLEAMIPDVFYERRHRLAATNKKADALLSRSLLLLDARDDAGAVRSIALPGDDGRAPAILHVVPLRRSAHDLFSGAHGIVVVTPVVARDAPDMAMLQGLFDLTPAEARVARGIVQGQTIDGIAVEFGSSRETVRTQVKSVLNKTGLKRNIDLAAMLAGIAQLAPGED